MIKPKALKIISLISFLFLSAISASAQLDVGRQTIAVTYPLDTSVSLQFRGTTRFPRMNADAKIKRTSKNGTQIEMSVSNVPRPYELGAGYATYILWAISPDGQIDNLGELKRRKLFMFDSKMEVTTPFQTFALIMTAEPHFLVRRPSRAVMLENVSPSSQTGKLLATSAVLSYLGNSSDYFNDARTPLIAEVDYKKTPSTILQARQAVALAKFAGAQRDAVQELQEAETLLQNAEKAWLADRSDEEIDIAARKAIGSAVKAEDTALVRREARLKRNEQTKQDAEIREAEDKFVASQNQLNELKSELAQETRRRELAERDALNYSNQIKDLRDENAKLREDLNKAKTEAEEAKLTLARIEGEKNAVVKQQEEKERINRLQSNQAVLIQSLRRYGTVAKTERGIVLTLAENWWSGTRLNTFAATAEPNISSLGELLANSTDYKITLEAHTDNKGTPDELEILTQERANLLMERIMSAGVTQDRIEAKGFGASLPIVPNTTNVNRAKNRRIQVILVPNF